MQIHTFDMTVLLKGISQAFPDLDMEVYPVANTQKFNNLGASSSLVARSSTRRPDKKAIVMNTLRCLRSTRCAWKTNLIRATKYPTNFAHVPCGAQGAFERVKGEGVLPCTELVGTLSDLWCLLARGLEVLSFSRAQDCTTLSVVQCKVFYIEFSYYYDQPF